MKTSFRVMEMLGLAGDRLGLFRMCEVDPEGRVIREAGHCANGCPGHKTQREAKQHFYEFVVAGAEFKRTIENDKKCVVCGRWTPWFLSGTVEGGIATCGVHERKVIVEALVR